MSIIIQGIEMPKSCIDCPCHDGEWGCCNITNNYIGFDENRPQDCPLKEVTPAIHAHWILKDTGLPECSHCGGCCLYMADYCPNCGAKMDVEENEK